jgi:hypothetical protein
MHNNIQLNPSMEANNSINFLDISTTRSPPNLKIGIYRKPTATDTTISFLSNHPREHKMASYQFLIRRILSLPLDTHRQHAEWQYIKCVAQSNNFAPLPTFPTETLHTTKNSLAPINHPLLPFYE